MPADLAHTAAAWASSLLMALTDVARRLLTPTTESPKAAAAHTPRTIAAAEADEGLPVISP